MEYENKVIDNDNQNISISYTELEKLRKTIENLHSNHHLEIAKILKMNNIKLSENNNGIFINLNNISNNIIKQIENYIAFIKTQESLINVDEYKKLI